MPDELDLQALQPIVLTGGSSRRFGRDKLVEAVGDGLLVDAPIAALRAVFGRRVAVVGACDARIAARADFVIDDRRPGVGPIGGILSAIEHAGAGVFVLAGDMPGVTAQMVRAVVASAASHPGAAAVMARSDRLEPCVALYRPAAAPYLRASLEAGRGSLHDAIPPDLLRTVVFRHETLASVNTPGDLARFPGGQRPGNPTVPQPGRRSAQQ